MSAVGTPQGQPGTPNALWVLSHPVTAAADAAAGIAGAAEAAAAEAASQIDANVFRQALHAFAATLNNALIGVPFNAGNFELNEVIFQANFSADVGFILIGGVAAQGAMTFRYMRNPDSLPIGP